MADAATGGIREVLEEKGETFLESGNGRVNWKALTGSNEAIWYSQKDNWGQLYLHDLQTGKQKSAITSGDGNVTELSRVDEAARMVYFEGVGKERGRDPYFLAAFAGGLLPSDCSAGSVAALGEARDTPGLHRTLRRFLLEAHEEETRCARTAELHLLGAPSDR